jgi:hypothetical protein
MQEKRPGISRPFELEVSTSNVDSFKVKALGSDHLFD